MTCAEFQKVLPYIIETGGNAEEEAHLRACPICSDLVTDLRYIAEQAKLLLPMHEPSPRVWEDIKGSLEREGLINKPARARGGLLSPKGKIRSPLWVAAASTALFILVGLFLYQRNDDESESSVTAAAVTQPHFGTASFESGFSEQSDQNLLSAVGEANPDLHDVYANGLQQVNSYISDAEQYLKAHPEDEAARQHLMDAYGQKTMLYDMATARSVE